MKKDKYNYKRLTKLLLIFILVMSIILALSVEFPSLNELQYAIAVLMVTLSTVLLCHLKLLGEQ